MVSSLDRAALSHSRDMIARDYFSHSSLGGATLAGRARQRGLPDERLLAVDVGEVIAWGRPREGTPQSLFKALDAVERATGRSS